MIRQITNSYLGDLQIHRRGYVASIETLPLNLNLSPQQAANAAKALKENPEVSAFSERIKFGAMFSNFTETTNIRINGVVPENEFATCPAMSTRVSDGDKECQRPARGKILVPPCWRAAWAKGRRHRRHCGHQQGRIGEWQDRRDQRHLGKRNRPRRARRYIHIDDAMEILRMPQREISEFAVSLKIPERVDRVARSLRAQLGEVVTDPKKRRFRFTLGRSCRPFPTLPR
jgi:putative ABC transport system permease protein